MASDRLGNSNAPDVKLAASNCARVVLDAYAIALQYAHDEHKAFNVAVRAWRLHNRSFPPDDAAREVASIIQKTADRPAADRAPKSELTSSVRRQS